MLQQDGFRQKLFLISTKVWAGRLFKFIYLNTLLKINWEMTNNSDKVILNLKEGGVS